MSQRFFVDLYGYSRRETAAVLDCSLSTVDTLVQKKILKGAKVLRGGVEMWRFGADAVAAADAHRKAHRDRWRPKMLGNLARGRSRSAAVRRMKAAARDDLPEIRRLADLVAGRLGPGRVRALLEGALR